MIDLSAYQNSDYDPGPFFRRATWYVTSWLFFETRLPWPRILKKSLLTVFGCRPGEGFVIKPGVKIKHPWLLTIGAHCWIGEGVWIDNLCEVTLGDQVVLSQGAYLLTGNHNYKKPSFDLILGSIEIKSGAWIAAKSIVCPGVVVGQCAVLTAGSVATQALDAHSIYTGNPATFKRQRELATSQQEREELSTKDSKEHEGE